MPERFAAGMYLAGEAVGGQFRRTTRDDASGVGLNHERPLTIEADASSSSAIEFVESVIEQATADHYDIEDLRRERDGSSRFDLVSRENTDWLTRILISSSAQIESMHRSYDGGATWRYDSAGLETLRGIVSERRRDALAERVAPLAAWA